MNRRRKGGTIRPELVKRIIIYGALLVLLTTAQCSFFANLRICPATPDLLLGAVVAIMLLDSKRSATVFALAAGVLADALGGSGLSLSPLFYILLAALLAAISDKFLPAFFSFAVLLIPAIALKAVFGMLSVYLIYSSLPIVYVLKNILLPEAAVTFILCLGVYPAVKLCSIPLDLRNKFSFK